MVKVLIGDIFGSKAQTLVNTINTVGVMGKGIALGFKKRYPDMFEDYRERCSRNEVRLGQPYLYKNRNGPWVLNFPTKDHWRSVSRLSDIEEGLMYLEMNYRKWGIRSLAVPPLGCGNGELEWRVVGPTLYRYLKLLDIPVELYAPYGTPEDELTPGFLKAELVRDDVKGNDYQEKINPAWIALVEIIGRICKEPYHWPVGRTRFQKIAFVATNEGLPTGLTFERGTYGPYSEDAKNVQIGLINNNLIKEFKKGNMFVSRVGPTYDDARRAYSKELEGWERIIVRVADLFNRMTTDEAEMVATILFSATELKRTKGIYSEEELLGDVMLWKQRRCPPFDRTDVATKIRLLGALGWLDAVLSKDMEIRDV